MYSATFGILWSVCTSTFIPFFSVLVATGNCCASSWPRATPPNVNATSASTATAGTADSTPRTTLLSRFINPPSGLSLKSDVLTLKTVLHSPTNRFSLFEFRFSNFEFRLSNFVVSLLRCFVTSLLRYFIPSFLLFFALPLFPHQRQHPNRSPRPALQLHR